MIKRFLAFFMVMCMCVGTSSTVYAAEGDSWTTTEEDEFITETAEVVIGEDGWATLELDTITKDDVAMPLGGTETWSATTATKVGTFTMEGNNLTPVKTIGADRDYLMIRADSFTASTAVKLTIQIREAYTTNVLGSKTSSATTSEKNLIAMCPIEKGDKVQISFRVTDANGNYSASRKCTITYSYRLTNSPM